MRAKFAIHTIVNGKGLLLEKYIFLKTKPVKKECMNPSFILISRRKR
jgi:hypothetical protein